MKDTCNTYTDAVFISFLVHVESICLISPHSDGPKVAVFLKRLEVSVGLAKDFLTILGGGAIFHYPRHIQFYTSRIFFESLNNL